MCWCMCFVFCVLCSVLCCICSAIRIWLKTNFENLQAKTKKITITQWIFVAMSIIWKMLSKISIGALLTIWVFLKQWSSHLIPFWKCGKLKSNDTQITSLKWPMRAKWHSNVHAWSEFSILVLWMSQFYTEFMMLCCFIGILSKIPT